MAIDLQITDRGDIMFFENNKKKSPFKLSFLVNKGVKISFDIIGTMPIAPDHRVFKLSFDVNTPKYNKDAMTVSDKFNILQTISMRLQTPLGDFVDNTDLGSKLELVRHRSMNDANVLKTIEGYVKDAISDLVTNPQVIAEPAVSYTTNYSQCVNIFIYENGNFLYSTQIK